MPTDASTRILVVEDEEALADTVRYNLEREGYLVTVAPDGRDALERFYGESPSLVILDLMLPELPARRAPQSEPSPTCRSSW
jgi:DNA-binding response OmpR family regulator